MQLLLKIGRGRGFFKKTEQERDQLTLQRQLRMVKKGEQRAKKLEELAEKENKKAKAASKRLSILVEEAKKKYPAAK